MTKTFEAQIAAHLAKYELRMDSVVRDSASEVFAAAQKPRHEGGHMPVQTGRLRNSLVASVNGKGMLSGATSAETLARGMEAGDILEAGWTAPHARPAEYGGKGRVGARFMGRAASRWPRIVARAVLRAKVQHR